MRLIYDFKTVCLRNGKRNLARVLALRSSITNFSTKKFRYFVDYSVTKFRLRITIQFINPLIFHL